MCEKEMVIMSWVGTRMWWKELRSRGSANPQMLVNVWKRSVPEMDEHFCLTEYGLSSQFSCSCAERHHFWNAPVAKMMEVWNTETEKAKAIIGLSRCLVTCTVSAIGPILLASVRGLCLPLCPGGRNGPGKAALEQQTHESEVTSQPGMVNCEVLIGKYPELLPSDWTRCCRVSPLHEPSCSFCREISPVECNRCQNVGRLECHLVLIETSRDPCSECGWPDPTGFRRSPESLSPHRQPAQHTGEMEVEAQQARWVAQL